MNRAASPVHGVQQPLVLPVIISGGSGSRLWPLSRKSFPKPFIPLPGGDTLMQRILNRIAALPAVRDLLIVTNREHYFLTRDALTDCVCPVPPAAHYLLEPEGRNTAPAMTAAALWAQGQEALADLPLLFLPADHLIHDQEGFTRAAMTAAQLARDGLLVTFGVQPDRPETGFGYIQQGEALAYGHRVARFLEKPQRPEAEAMLSEGGFLWNSGMFCMTAATLLQEMALHAPEVLRSVQAAMESARINGDTTDLPASFAAAPDISIDYALMEKSQQAAVVTASFDWNDVGAWGAYSRMIPEDAQGNRLQCRDHTLLDSQRCMVHSPHRLTAMIGVEDLLVVDTPDALLIAHRDRDQEVKTIVQQLKDNGHASVDLHVTAHRPWGTYTVLEEGDRFKIKRIVVKPGHKLSLQMHHHRSEHWIVVSGTARIVNGEQERLILTDQSTYIPACTPHRLENPGVIDLVMIEVQSGAYLGEDDIVRFSDIYGRSPETVGKAE
jgi:mannose-1-phosphate guanylyltransferase/mannose-6-phosphate isomerase